jgi:hypothetical protein
MIMSRYRYRPVTVFGPTLPNITQRDINVTDRYRPLPNLTVTCVTSVTGRNIVCFEQIFKFLLKKLM